MVVPLNASNMISGGNWRTHLPLALTEFPCIPESIGIKVMDLSSRFNFIAPPPCIHAGSEAALSQFEDGIRIMFFRALEE